MCQLNGEQHHRKKFIKNFVATLLKGRFFIFFTVAFLLFLDPVGGSNPVGPIA